MAERVFAASSEYICFEAYIMDLFPNRQQGAVLLQILWAKRRAPENEVTGYLRAWEIYRLWE